MSRHESRRTSAVALLVVLWAAPFAQAQVARSGGGANAQLLQQLQQLATERTAMQAENARMKKELDDVRKERDALKKAQQGVDARTKQQASALAESNARRESTDEELKRTKDRMQELVDKFRETVTTLRGIETESTTTKQTLATRDRELQVCIDRNLALYKLNLEVLSRLEHQSAWSRVAATEPFTKLKRVQLENLVDDYKARADDQRVTPEVLKSAGGSPPPPPPAAGTPPH